MEQEREPVYDLYSPMSYKSVLFENYVLLASSIVCAIMFSILLDNIYFAFVKEHLPLQMSVMIGAAFWLFFVVIAYIVVDLHKKRLGIRFPLLSEVLNVGFKMQAATKLSESLVMTLGIHLVDQVSVLPYRDPDIMLRVGYAGSFRQLIVMTKDDDYLVMYNSNYQVVRFKKITEDL